MISLASERDAPTPVEDPDPAPPQVFVRAFSVPAGLPWEQSRAAQLDARHGSPLPIDELLVQLRRLDRWSPGKPARYAAFYVRAQDYSAPFETTLQVDGHSVTVAFGARRQDLDRVKLAAVIGLIIALTGAVLGGSLTMALGARSQAQTALDTTEQLVLTKRRTGLAYQVQIEQARGLRREIGRARPVEEALADLDWAAAAKAPDARISALHWDHGLLGIEARGPAPPLIPGERPLQRAGAPLRPGVWLWGVEPRASRPRAFLGAER